MGQLYFSGGWGKKSGHYGQLSVPDAEM